MGMNVRQALCDLVARKDPSVFQSQDRFIQSMEGLAGPQTGEIKALASGLQARIPWDLRKSSDPATLDRMLASLQNSHGMSPEQAWWTLETWAAALSVTLPARPGQAVVPGASPSAAAPTAPTTPLGIEFICGSDGLINVARVWSHDLPARAAGGSGLAQAVKAEEASARPLPVAPAAPKPAPRASPPSAAPPGPGSNTGVGPEKPTGPNAGRRSSKGGVPPTPRPQSPPPVRETPSGRPAGQVFFHFSPPGSASPQAGAPARPVAPTPPAPPKLPPVEKSLGPRPPSPPAREASKPVPTPVGVEEQFKLGLALLEGTTTHPNHPEALRLLRLAAGQGHVPAGFHLGMALLRGHGAKENPKDAEKWFRWAADKGHADAMVQLGSLYQCGYGVPMDLKEARRWFGAAALKGHPEAAELLKNLPT